MKELARIVFSQNSECSFNLPFTDFEPLFSSYFSDCLDGCLVEQKLWRLVLSLVRTVGIYMDTVWRNVMGGGTRNTFLPEMLADCFLLKKCLDGDEKIHAQL